jgi:Fur family transcriptional regulator, ferric uptake regulator
MSTRAGASFNVREEIDRRLAKSGQRWTKGRRLVLEALQGAGAPMSATELQAKVGPSVPLSSLYRIISDLVQANVLIKLEFAEGFARFELDEGLADHHHHLVCTECGSVADLELPDLEIALDATSKPIKKRSGFQVVTHRLDFFGLCRDCAAKA